jgi:DnaJ-class molecular chaperone
MSDWPSCCPICKEELDWVDCDRCGGNGFVEYNDAPEIWGEDCPGEINYLVTCPECGGTGGGLDCPNAENHYLLQH